MSPSSAPSDLRRLLTAALAIALAIALIGAGAFGVQTLRAAPVSFCDDPMRTCALGGNERCSECCQLAGDPDGVCALGQVCVCIQG